MHDLNPYECAKEFVTHTGRNIFITGKAGTGKTTFLRHFRAETTRQVAVVAPTGVAAINAGGATIHSFFQLPFTPFTPTPAGREALITRIKMNSSRRRVIRELEVLVIDEVSMVRADVLDAIDTVLRSVRHRRSEPFGGVQLVFIGDVYQLSPVAKADEWRILSEYYQGIYFFHSHVIQEHPPVYVEFDRIFRQSDDLFIDVLNQVRNDSLSPEGFELLQNRYDPHFNPTPDENYITLTTHNFSADAINTAELGKINTDAHPYHAVVKGEFPENAFPVERVLTLKEGAKVMFVKNDMEAPRRYFNGKIGTITRIMEESVTVLCPDDTEEITVSPVLWENIRYTTHPETNTVEEEIIGTYKQVPLRLAWAITIHKSQGLTFDKAIIDAGKAFSPGQVYVALSRCRSLDSLVLKSPINRYSIGVDEQVVRFSSSKPEESRVAAELRLAKEQFSINLLLQLYDFEPLLQTARSWYSDTKENESSFSEETVPFVSEICNQLTELEQVAGKFRIQLQHITGQIPVDKAFFAERLRASSSYFTEKIGILLRTLQESAATTDSKANAQQYDEDIASLFSAAALKAHLISATSDNFNIESYYNARRQFRQPPFSFTSYSRDRTGVQLKSIHPELLSELVQLRNRISKEENLPVYIVASVKTLVQMADYLPETEKELLKIHGFGKVKAERFGTQFLEMIHNYITAYGIESRMIHFKEDKKPRKRKNKG
ncbi:HRDC domain-containing protein [Proteiniphilum sp. UBA1028]|jgi:RecA/RadA recombinase|uniref:HRDC domain-containing protein n=1 Tax=Proteiniphilum sp. UBA1028 TaxID=1947251 RepID=UPI0025FD033C|nr:HRDC domain-containing protein [Proteiniphilum sp. UBA1028]